MKRFIFLFAIIPFFLIVNPAQAQYCTSITDAVDCASQPYCRWAGSSCVDNLNANPVGGDRLSFLFPVIDPLAGKYNNPLEVISSLLPYVLTFAGLILFAMLIFGGFQMMTAGSDAKKADAGKARVTTAVVGFVIVFAAYWITQLLELILGIRIFSP